MDSPLLPIERSRAKLSGYEAEIRADERRRVIDEALEWEGQHVATLKAEALSAAADHFRTMSSGNTFERIEIVSELLMLAARKRTAALCKSPRCPVCAMERR
jgi:hypothetical protein